MQQAKINLAYTTSRRRSRASSRRDWSTRVSRRRRRANEARHHRPDRSDLRELQRQRAAGAPDPRAAAQGGADAEGPGANPGRGRPADGDRIFRTRALDYVARRSTRAPARSRCGRCSRKAVGAAAGLFVRVRVPGRNGRGAAGARQRARQRPGGATCSSSRQETSSSSARWRPERWSDGLRVIESGLQPQDRVVVGGIQRAVPGRRSSTPRRLQDRLPRLRRCAARRNDRQVLHRAADLRQRHRRPDRHDRPRGAGQAAGRAISRTSCRRPCRSPRAIPAPARDGRAHRCAAHRAAGQRRRRHDLHAVVRRPATAPIRSR